MARTAAACCGPTGGRTTTGGRSSCRPSPQAACGGAGGGGGGGHVHGRITMRPDGILRRTPIAPILRGVTTTTPTTRLPLLTYLVLGLLTLLPRVIDLGGFVTGDESLFWMRRSQVFLDAISTGDYAATAISTHPGVTTMWLGALGILLRDWLDATGLVPTTNFATALTMFRLPVVLIHTLGVLLGYRMMRRLLAPSIALLAALLWALDPFTIAYSRMLHVDALCGTFAILSVLALACAREQLRPSVWLLASGTAAGLALLSKSPALVLLPCALLLVGVAAWERRMAHPAWRRRALGGLLVWGAALLAIVMMLYPALWVDPRAALTRVRDGVEAEGASPHVAGNYFLGREDDTPGVLFYPVAWALRTTPWALVGLLLLPALWRRLAAPEQRALAAVGMFALALTCGLTLFEKKLNRYVMPAAPAIQMLAAAGLVGWLRRPALRTTLIAAVGAGALATVVSIHPYSIAYFNPLLGGPAAGPQNFLAGTGEGLEQAAAWLAAQPDITGVVTISPIASSIQPYMPDRAQIINPTGAGLPHKTGYAVVYLRQTQRAQIFPPFDTFVGREVPLHTVHVLGVPYAWIYRVPPVPAQPLLATFGAAAALRGSDLPHSTAAGTTLTFPLYWRTQAPRANTNLFVHVYDAQGRRVAQSDLPLTLDPTPGRYTTTNAAVALSADLPPGTYRVVLGVYDTTTGARLPVEGAAFDPAVGGADAVVVGAVRIP